MNSTCKVPRVTGLPFLIQFKARTIRGKGKKKLDAAFTEPPAFNAMA